MGHPPLLPGRRQPGPRRRRAHALRRPQLAAHRHGVRGALLLPRDVIALIAGFFGGITDSILSRLLDLIWAFPVFLLAISISTSRYERHPHLGFTTLKPAVSGFPILIISLVYVPYVARPIRGEVLSVREKEFVEACDRPRCEQPRLIFSEVLPNVDHDGDRLLPADDRARMLTESALSFLSIGVQPPDASWGTIINDGQGLLYTRPWVAIAPGSRSSATVLCLNVLGDGVRDALDPRAKLRVGRQAGGETPPDAALDVTLDDRFHHPQVDRGAARDVRDQRARVPDLLRDAEHRSGRTHRRPQCDPETLKQVRHDFGLDRPLPVQYAIMMKKLFWSRDLTSFVNRGAKIIPADRRRRARDALARLRSADHLGRSSRSRWG